MVVTRSWFIQFYAQMYAFEKYVKKLFRTIWKLQIWVQMNNAVNCVITITTYPNCAILELQNVAINTLLTKVSFFYFDSFIFIRELKREHLQIKTPLNASLTFYNRTCLNVHTYICAMFKISRNEKFCLFLGS